LSGARLIKRLVLTSAGFDMEEVVGLLVWMNCLIALPTYNRLT
jgi:hypothetical protein